MGTAPVGCMSVGKVHSASDVIFRLDDHHRGSFPSGLSFSRMMTTSQGGGVGDAKGSVASELTDA